MNAQVESFTSADELSGYRTISALAVAGLLLGLASPLCLFGKVLMFVPIAGAAVSLLALRRIAVSDGGLVGRRAALIGLILSVSCAAVAVSYGAVTRRLRTRQASAVGYQWIALILKGDTKSAFHLSSGHAAPDPNREEGFGAGGNPYNRFVEAPLVDALLKAGADAAIHGEEVIQYAAQGQGEFLIRQIFVVTPRAGGPSDGAAAQRPPLRFVLQLQRTRPLDGPHVVWLVNPVDRVLSPDSPDAAHSSNVQNGPRP
jgi:hypothetical protein